MNKEQWLSPQGLADELGVPLTTVYAWFTDGIGPKRHKIGRHTRIARKDLDAWLKTKAVD